MEINNATKMRAARTCAEDPSFPCVPCTTKENALNRLHTTSLAIVAFTAGSPPGPCTPTHWLHATVNQPVMVGPSTGTINKIMSCLSHHRATTRARGTRDIDNMDVLRITGIRAMTTRNNSQKSEYIGAKCLPRSG